MIKKLFTLCLGSLFVLSAAWGQTTYNLSFSPTIAGTKLRVQVDLSYDVAGKLGTSNFVFNYNNAALVNPVLFANNTPGPFYQTPTVTTPTSTTTSLNVELLVAGFGIAIGTTPTNVATIEFDITDPAQMTGSENGNDYFLIERSIDGRHYENIAFVPGAGYSFELMTYQSLDARPKAGLNYYRLKQVDFNGTFQYSDIEVVKFKNPGVTINVFPNPTTEYINIERSEANDAPDILLYDQSGKLVLQEAWSEGDFQKRLQMDLLPRGIYMLMLDATNAGRPTVQKIILQ